MMERKDLITNDQGAQASINRMDIKCRSSETEEDLKPDRKLVHITTFAMEMTSEQVASEFGTALHSALFFEGKGYAFKGRTAPAIKVLPQHMTLETVGGKTKIEFGEVAIRKLSFRPCGTHETGAVVLEVECEIEAEKKAANLQRFLQLENFVLSAEAEAGAMFSDMAADGKLKAV